MIHPAHRVEGAISRVGGDSSPTRTRDVIGRLRKLLEHVLQWIIISDGISERAMSSSATHRSAARLLHGRDAVAMEYTGQPPPPFVTPC